MKHVPFGFNTPLTNPPPRSRWHAPPGSSATGGLPWYRCALRPLGWVWVWWGFRHALPVLIGPTGPPGLNGLNQINSVFKKEKRGSPTLVSRGGRCGTEEEETELFSEKLNKKKTLHTGTSEGFWIFTKRFLLALRTKSRILFLQLVLKK